MTPILSIILTLVFTAAVSPPEFNWTIQDSGTTARLRGVSAVNENVVWSSGSSSTVLRTADGGATWKKLAVTTDQLDFRDIDAVDSNTAYLLSIGNGPTSRIYKTTDSGLNWKLQFKNEDPKAFFDAMSFWDAEHGLVLGDSINGEFCIMITENGGNVWKRVPSNVLPPALDNEGAFAASGTNITLIGKTHAWVATGAAAKARVLRTADRGRTWQVSETPMTSGPSAGIFSIAFRDTKHGVIVGGDYQKETEAINNVALTDDGGVTWNLAKGLTGYRSVVMYVPGLRMTFVAVGPSGADYSVDDGRTWKPIPGRGFDTLSFARGKNVGWATGTGGSIGKLTFTPQE
jgi:photosystem II stability/assembly factor-like uncharacterized protein